jgi:hypothetical protein
MYELQFLNPQNNHTTSYIKAASLQRYRLP